MKFPSLILALNTDDGKSKLTEFLGLSNSTFVVRAINNDMSEAQILEGDYIFVDPTVAPQDGMIVLANEGANILLRRYVVTPHATFLACEDRDCKDIELNGESQTKVLGVVTGYFHPLLS